MTVYEAPAKLNLSLLVSPPRHDGLHPIDSLIQTIDWCDRLEIDRWEGEDRFESDFDDDLIERALREARQLGPVPPLSVTLEKEIPAEAGLGGGSSDAAAMLLACHHLGEVRRDDLPAAAARIGSDVALFLTGGTMVVAGAGEQIEEAPPAHGFALAVVVPRFGLTTRSVYARWDELEGPVGDEIDPRRLPPSLRDRMPMRNDLLPAALDMEPTLGDFMADVAAIWGAPVCLTGSGSACFGYFPTLDEAEDAARSVGHLVAESRGVTLRPRGVARVE